MSEIVTVTYTPDEIRIFGEDSDFMGLPVTVLATEPALSPGTPMGQVTLSGKYKKYNSAAVDGSENFAGLLQNAVNPTAEGRDVLAAIWFTGYFDHAKVTALGFDANALSTTPGARVIPGRNILILPGA